MRRCWDRGRGEFNGERVRRMCWHWDGEGKEGLVVGGAPPQAKLRGLTPMEGFHKDLSIS